MTKERWQEVKIQVEQNFQIMDSYTEDLEPGLAEVLEFDTPNGRIKARFVTRPKVLDKKTQFSHRPGSDVKVEYVYSDTEQTSYLEIYTWSEDRNDWQKMESQTLF